MLLSSAVLCGSLENHVQAEQSIDQVDKEKSANANAEEWRLMNCVLDESNVIEGRR